jgi:ribonucleotide monophosphatase NagD (HAD superfamily)
MMMRLTKWISATLAVAVMASTVGAADTVAAGKIKSIDADGKTFVLTDAADKDSTFTFGDHLIVNRGGKESKTSLKAGDAINVCYDKGAATSTAHYVLVQEGKSKTYELLRGTVKSIDAGKSEFTFTNENNTDSTYSLGKATVRVNLEDSTMANVKTGEAALLIVNTANGNATLRSVMIDRAK